MMKSIKTKIMTSFIALMVLMITLVSHQTYAETLEEKHLENASITGAREFEYNDLASIKELLCGQHKKHIPSLNDINTVVIRRKWFCR